jgi:hypothetical protein
MDQNLIVNDMLIYIGTLLVAAAMFAFIGLCFIGLLLVGLAARGLQLVALKLGQAVARQWTGLRGQGSVDQANQEGAQPAFRAAEMAESAGTAIPGPTTEAVRLAEP